MLDELRLGSREADDDIVVAMVVFNADGGLKGGNVGSKGAGEATKRTMRRKRKRKKG